NRSYAAQWLDAEKDNGAEDNGTKDNGTKDSGVKDSDANDPAARLLYEAPDVFPKGAHIEKTIQLEGPNAVRVAYRISLNAADGNGTGPKQSFTSVNSLPAISRPGRQSAFCWELRGSAGNEKPDARPDAKPDAKSGSKS